MAFSIVCCPTSAKKKINVLTVTLFHVLFTVQSIILIIIIMMVIMMMMMMTHGDDDYYDYCKLVVLSVYLISHAEETGGIHYFL